LGLSSVPRINSKGDSVRHLKTALLSLALFTAGLSAASQDHFTYKPIVTNLAIPWEIERDDDGTFWVSERSGLISRVNPSTGEKKVLLDLRDSVELTIENGMLGFVTHPRFPEEKYAFHQAELFALREAVLEIITRLRAG
jgi:glucose/arabinose dehydrogenase